MPASEQVGKKRTLAGKWVQVSSPFHGLTSVFVPATVFSEGTLPEGAYMVPMVGGHAGSGFMAVIVCTVHSPHLCVGMARLMCDQALQDLP